MFGSDYLLGRSQGRASAEDEQETRVLVGRVLYGQRPVTVDQSYIDWLEGALADAQSTSRHNFGAADAFELEAGKWKAYAQAQEARVAQLQTLLAEREVALEAAHAALEQELAAHKSTNAEKLGLNLFRLIATWLLDAHIASRSHRLAFAEMRDMAKLVSDAIERGETFHGYRDEPETKARLQALLEELLRA
jgi:hypothetical protein